MNTACIGAIGMMIWGAITGVTVSDCRVDLVQKMIGHALVAISAVKSSENWAANLVILSIPGGWVDRAALHADAAPGQFPYRAEQEEPREFAYHGAVVAAAADLKRAAVFNTHFQTRRILKIML